MSEESQFSEDENLGWIQWFCSLEDHQFFCEVNDQFIKDERNLYGLKGQVEQYAEALKMILKSTPPAQEEIQDEKFTQLYVHATQLYGLIHARYISTPEGMAIMREHYFAGKFGHCPRVMCEKQNAMPIAINQDLKIARAKLYCPRCKDIYSPKKKFSDTDGAYFGTTFPHLMLMTYPDLSPFFKREEFVPQIFGFKIVENSEASQEQTIEKQKPEVTLSIAQELKEQSVLKPASKKRHPKKKMMKS